MHMESECSHRLLVCDFKDLGYTFMVSCTLHMYYQISFRFIAMQGFSKDMQAHCRNKMAYHTGLMKQVFDKVERTFDDRIKALQQQNSDLMTEFNNVKLMIDATVKPVSEAVVASETAIQHLQEGFTELSLGMQKMQAASYDGVVIWKIPEVQRRKHEANFYPSIPLHSTLPGIVTNYAFDVI